MIDKITTYKPASAPLRILTNWSDGIHPSPKPPFPLKGVKDMNEEEQADEIIRRLSQPYKIAAERLEDEMLRVLSAEIAKEIDNEVISHIKRIYSTHTTNAKESNT